MTRRSLLLPAAVLALAALIAAIVALRAAGDPPLANDDRYYVDADTALVVHADLGVLINDDDPNGDPVTATLDTDAANGKVALSADGSFTYTPNPGARGQEVFTYTVSDGRLKSAPVAVTIEIDPDPGNTPPVAEDDAYVTPQDTPLTIAAPSMLANDRDPDGDPIFFDHWGDIVGSGELQVNANGAFTYEPPPGYSGTFAFTYVAGDGHLESAPATVTITIE
jgi:hypothetical protein